MTQARQSLVSLDDTPYYHCISRCVRRAFLCGVDALSGESFEHRKSWIVERLGLLSSVYAIEVAAYVVMSNHYHLVLRVDRDRALTWSDQEVVDRWARLFSLPTAVARWKAGACSSDGELDVALSLIGTWRERLMDLSWFMRGLNEFVARRANAEDGCTGRFWEGRFKSQALLDEAAVLTAMAYVDLNPVRAKMVSSPEGSDHTSIQQRIEQAVGTSASADTASAGDLQDGDDEATVRPALMPLVRASCDAHPNAIGFDWVDYLELVDWSGRVIREDKRGALAGNLPPVLQRLGLCADGFAEHVQGHARRPHPRVLGRVGRIRELAHAVGQGFLHGMGESRRLYAR